MAEPSLTAIWGLFTGYQRTFALKAGVELDVFTAIAEGTVTVDGLAKRCGAAPRGMRALLEFLTMEELVVRDGDRYALTPVAAMFLDRNAPAFVGSALGFIASPMICDAFSRLTDAVRRGGTAVPAEGTLAAEHPVWVEFARSMAPLAGMSAVLLGNLLDAEHAPGWKILDVAAGHGMFGIALARMNPRTEVTALDWPNVLTVARENAEHAQITSRYRTIAGSAFDVAWGAGYDLVLLPNILHHFDPPGCETLLAKAHAALAPGGRVVLVEFVPDDDRTGPPDALRFSLVMLATTPSGAAYTFADYKKMLARAGFTHPAELHDLTPSPARAVIATR